MYTVCKFASRFPISPVLFAALSITLCLFSGVTNLQSTPSQTPAAAPSESARIPVGHCSVSYIRGPRGDLWTREESLFYWSGTEWHRLAGGSPPAVNSSPGPEQRTRRYIVRESRPRYIQGGQGVSGGGRRWCGAPDHLFTAENHVLPSKY